MNYIKLLNAAFEKFFFDDRLNPSHISLYMALFQEWNSSRFANDFFVNRKELMRVSKIGSKSTYHRCINDLDSWCYLCYFPSNNPYKGSKVKMAIIGTTDEPDMGRYDPILEQLAGRYRPKNEPVAYQHRPNGGQVVYRHRPTSGQALVSNINNIKHVNNTKHVNIKHVNNIKQPKGRQAVLIFFKEKGFDTDEGKKFYEHYENNDWKTSDGKAIRDWRALAKNWMDRTELFAKENKPNKKGASHNRDNLKTTKNKNYGQPL